MASLDFHELARLINHTRTTQISIQASRTGDGWSLHDGTYRVHQMVQPFTVTYLNSRITEAGIAEAKRNTRGDHAHVVYAGSLENRHQNIKEALGSPGRVWTAQDYLRSFIQAELSQYRDRLLEQDPKYYIDPRVETPAGFLARHPNPVRTFLTSPPGATIGEDHIAVLLADPGQGKTYMCRRMVAELCRSPAVAAYPIFVDSSQWLKLTPDDLRSFSVTVANSFRQFGASIGWLDGHEEEFLLVSLKAGLFRIVFDGFDEYVLRGQGTISPAEALETISDLGRETGSRIVVTSRTAFWESNLPQDLTEQFLARTGQHLFRLLPFDEPTARNYFLARLQQPSQQETASRVFRLLAERSPDLVGRGFVLSILADLIGNQDVDPLSALNKDEEGGSLVWLIRRLCQREQLRQALPLDATEQLSLFQSLALELGAGETVDSGLLELMVESIRKDLAHDTRKKVIEKLKSHPLLRFQSGSSWHFSQQQVYVALLARALDQAIQTHDGAGSPPRLRLKREEIQDLASDLVVLHTERSAPDDAVASLAQAINSLRGSKSGTTADSQGVLTTAVILRAVDKMRPRGSQRDARSELLLRLCNQRANNLRFEGSIGSFDLRGVRFEDCVFAGVVFANCLFDSKTSFERCEFLGGKELQTQGLGLANFAHCRYDDEASTWVNAARVREGSRQYSLADLDSELTALAMKFVGQRGTGVRTMKDHNLRKGSIALSHHKETILDRFCGMVVDSHEISGISDKGWHVREDAKESLTFLAANNVITGRLRECRDAIAKALKLL